MKITIEKPSVTRDRIIHNWRSLDPVEQSMHVLNNSMEYRLFKYADSTPLKQQEYYINSEGELTTWSLDPTIQQIQLNEFLSKPQSSNLVADKQV
jgi:hypothetical protein